MVRSESLDPAALKKVLEGKLAQVASLHQTSDNVCVLCVICQYIELQRKERESKCGQRLDIKDCDEGSWGHYSYCPFIFPRH